MKRYHVTTFGCQMNAHDSERIKGMLEELGYGETHDADNSDVIVFNTCTIRDKPDQKLYQRLYEARQRKRDNPDMVLAVGGCLVEAQKERLFNDFPWIDVAFGPGRIENLGMHLAAANGSSAGFFGIGDERTFAADLPQHRSRKHQAWVQISMGCNKVCAYCIVPHVRGREVSRPHQPIIDEVAALADDGVRQITLLGQNVNSYGRDLPRDERLTFAELLAEVDAIDGIERIRFTSPHPQDMRDDAIAAMAELPAVCEQMHLPLQSGSDRILKSMRRTYNTERYLTLVDKLRAAVPDIALSTDIIVGFPGETEADFEATLDIVRQVKYDSAYTFIYSSRAGTEAADMDDHIDPVVQHDRLERLVDVYREHAGERLQRHVGKTQPVLVEGPSRTSPDRRRGRTRHDVITNFVGDADEGEIVDVLMTEASTATLRGEQVAVAAPAGR